MRLIRLKLAGFKSFVDSTTLHFPQSRTAIVGPNGCGKSNVIDAIRWVMGESSARQLRGDRMADVIFAGTLQRNPVGQASVELCFENTQGQLGGAYNAYSELSVRRQVRRDGHSDYFLNGTRCRRRDITDIFLGTGLGSRSYAMIEQGMINRLVDARPEEMRQFIEEAAGISRYQARRRDTLQHLEHTRQNLARLQDMHDELQAQRRSLKRQHQAVLHCEQLARQQRALKISLWSLQYDVAAHAQQQHARQLGLLGEQFAQLRHERQQAEAAWQASHEQITQLLAQIEPLQQQWQQLEREVSQRQAWLQQYQHDQQQCHSQIGQWQQTLSLLNRQAVQDQQQLEALALAIDQHATALNQQQLTVDQALAQSSQASRHWQALQGPLRATEQQYQQQARQQQQLKQQIAASTHAKERLSQQLEQLNAQLTQLHQQQPQQALEELAHLRAQQQAQQAGLMQQQADLQHQLQQQLLQLQHTSEQLKQHQTQQQEAQLELAALQKLQVAPAKQDAAGNQSTPHMLQHLVIKPAAQAHVPLLEKFLADWLHALVAINDLPRQLSMPQPARVVYGWHDQQQAVQASVSILPHDEVTPLSAWIEPVLSCWQGVGIIASRQQALVLQALLQPHQSLLTLDGFWLGPDWQINLAIDPQATRQQGLLQQQLRQQALQQTLAQLGLWIEPLAHQVSIQQQAVDDCRAQLQPIDRQLADLHRQLGELDIRQARLETSLASSQQQINRLNAQQADLQRTLQADDAQLDSWQMQLSACTHQLTLLGSQIEQQTQQLQQRMQHMQGAQQQHQQAQQQLQQLQQQAAQHQLQQENLLQALARALPQQQHIEQQLAQLEQQRQLATADYPIQQQQLADYQAQAAAAQQQCSHMQQQLSVHQQEQQRLNPVRQQQSREDALRDQLEQTRLDWQHSKIAMQQAAEQLAVLEAPPAPGDTPRPLPPDAQHAIQQWQAQIDQLQQQIDAAGPLNLAAPQEVALITQRQTELAHQIADLQHTVEQLEQAMHTIDQRTRNAFMTTLEQVNQELKQLFPKIFGGGEASLMLRDGWQSGVCLMARPPGKRNTSLALLSGGEKALTALALVFAIFRLNPAPFCVLDEVDAPLDDANVQRFCHLVKELSQQVQFIYITHNKLAMSMATDLLGVTMSEPGVSQLVSVNIEQAAKFSATSE